MTVKPIACRRPAVSALLIGLALTLAGASIVRAQEPPTAAAQSAAAAPQGVPVRLDGETLFYAAKGIGPFSAFRPGGETGRGIGRRESLRE